MTLAPISPVGTGLAMHDEFYQGFDLILEEGIKPILLCDVDGVLRSFGENPWPGGTSVAKVNSAKFEYAPKLIDRIRTIILSGSVDFVWSTTWCDRIDYVCAAWDLPRFRVPYDYDGPITTPAWLPYYNGASAIVLKLAVLQAAIDTGRPVIHLDDHVGIGARSDRLLSLRPVEEAGLSPADMDTVEAFIAAHA